MLKISILTIGDEILIGQITNRNAAWLSEKCTRLGCNVLHHATIGDERDAMVGELDRLSDISDIILITGGLGPTHDDITKPVLNEYFDDEYTENQDVLDYLHKFFERRDEKLSDRNKKLAQVPSKCKVLLNKVGTAPGMKFGKNGKYYISMPGVPTEMKQIMNDYVLPFIKERLMETKENVVLYKILQTAGIVESKLADLIGDVDEFIEDGTFAFLPSYKGVRMRIGIHGDDLEKAKDRLDKIEKTVYEKAGEYIYGENDDSLEAAVGRLLKEKGKKVAVAESCTAGMLGAAFTDEAGSSDYFEGGAIVYSNEAKQNILGVREDTLIAHGAVSEETAMELAANVRDRFSTDYGIGITGIAGPGGGTRDKPVGTVWIGIADENGSSATRHVFGDDRAMNRERSVGVALTKIYKKLKEL